MERYTLQRGVWRRPLSMYVVFNKIALAELNDAVTCYELELEGLGERFRKEIQNGIKRIAKNPNAWSK